jgi:GNAT superfamily N-acetyltransferase
MITAHDLKLRRMTIEDIPAGMLLCRAAGWNQLEDDWRVFLTSSRSGAVLVETQGQVVGTCAYIHYGSLAWIAMMLVHPEERGSGIGAHLMTAVLNELRDTECVGLDATPLGEPLYRRSGFVNDYGLVRTKAIINAAGFGVLSGRARRMQKSDLPHVLVRDREVFGADRGLLLTLLLDRAPDCAWIVEEEATLRGYCFGRPGRLYHLLGPVVAEDRGTARDLVSACLVEQNGQPFAIDAPRLDAEWVAWLASVGFTEERPFVRMFRRDKKHPGIPPKQYAIGGPEFA